MTNSNCTPIIRDMCIDNCRVDGVSSATLWDVCLNSCMSQHDYVRTTNYSTCLLDVKPFFPREKRGQPHLQSWDIKNIMNC